MAGGVVSTTVTVWLQVMLLEQASVARQVRVALKVFPQRRLVIVPTTAIELVPQLSLAVGGSKVQTLPHSTVFGPTQTITGGVVSTTTMV
jgi:hypothetical protein